MKENKTGLSGLNILGNGTQPQDYIPVLLLQTVRCKSCGVFAMTPPQAVLWGKDIISIQNEAIKFHTQAVITAKLLCSKPQLIITYVPGLIWRELIGE
jgi:hypothetical protein